LAFSDNDPGKWNTQIDGLTVLPPESAIKQFALSAVFVVSIWSIRHTYTDRLEQLKGLGCAHVMPPSWVFWKFSKDLLPDYCMDLPHKVFEEADSVKRAFSVWSDDASRKEYLAQIRWRALGDYELLARPDIEGSYFPADVFSLHANEVFVDCGAFDGDTVQDLLRRENGKFDRIMAIEPDPINIGKLRQYIDSLEVSQKEKVSILNLAVGSKRGKVGFSASGTDASAITKDSSYFVECAPLDEILADWAPTYIKMDIEGAEPDALAGTARTIREHQPILAVCVYHTQNHVWQIPLQIHDLCPGYKLFLRPHDFDGWQVVCYAIPEKRWRKQ
jgi:FkbM family methyltransferase